MSEKIRPISAGALRREEARSARRYEDDLEEGVQSMNKRSPLIAGTFAVLTTLLSSPPDAEANFKRQHASSCMEDSLQPLALFQDQFLVNTSESFFDFFFCGMPEDTALRKDRVVQLTLAGIDESTSNAVFVRACVGFSSGFGLQ